jgi:hypothetical protein
MKRFIISPIGESGSAAREHADDVLECVIQPALEKAGVSGRRADQVKDVGRITNQMFDDIITSDFCIAVLLAGMEDHAGGIPLNEFTLTLRNVPRVCHVLCMAK